MTEAYALASIAVGERGLTPREREQRLAARRQVLDAIQRGDLPRIGTVGCAECGKPSSDYHHHLGYALEHALDVKPLCRPCHGAAHRKQLSRTELWSYEECCAALANREERIRELADDYSRIHDFTREKYGKAPCIPELIWPEATV